MKTIPLVILLAALVPITSAAQMYKCSEDGKTVFQERPCTGKGQAISVRSATGDAPQTTSTSQTQVDSAKNPASKDSDRLAKMQRERRLREIDYEISDSEQAIRKQEREMEAELSVLQEKKGRAKNNLAGATFEQSISSEMQVVTDKYRIKISSTQAKLDNLRKERETLRMER